LSDQLLEAVRDPNRTPLSFPPFDETIYAVLNGASSAENTNQNADEQKPPSQKDILKGQLQPDAKLGISRPRSLPDFKTPEGVSVYDRSSAFVQRVSRLVAQFPKVWTDSGTIDVPEEEQMRVPLVEGYQNQKIGQRPYPLSQEDREIVDKTLDDLHAQGRVEWVTQPTPFGAPAFVVWRMVNGARKGRMVIDLRALNKVTIPDAYPMPLQQDVIRKLRGKLYISVIDARSFFHQFLVYKPHRERFTIVSHRGQEQSKVALMGFRNSPAYAQRFMDRLLRPFRDFVAAFIDDIVIFSDNEADHLKHLEEIFSLFTKKRVSLSANKSFLGYPSVQLLGFKVDAFGLSNTEDRTAAIRRIQFPKTLQDLERWIGMTGYLRHLIPRFSKRIGPLQDRKTLMLAQARELGKDRGSARKAYTRRTDFTPTKAEIDAFEDVKAALMRDEAVYHHDPERVLYLQIDASKENGFSALLFHTAKSYLWDKKSHIPRTVIQPIKYISKTLNTAEKKYWPTELEVACLVWAVRTLRTEIQSSRAKPTVVLTDHAATCGILKQTSLFTTDKARSNLRLQLSSEYLSQFALECYHIPGRSNVIADALSRLKTDEKPIEDAGELDKIWDDQAVYHTSELRIDPDTKKQITDGYNTDKKWKDILGQLQSATGEAKLPFILDDGLIFFEEFSGKRRLCIPFSVAPQLIAAAHDEKHHFGIERTWRQLVDQFCIPKLKATVEQYIHKCPVCRANGTDRQKPLGELQPILTPPIPFHKIAMDFILGMPEVPAEATPWHIEGFPIFNACMTVTDKFTKASLIIPGHSKYTAEDWATSLLRMLRLANWGLPKAIISDRDRKFLSDFWQGLWNELGTKLLFSTAYHPQTDGLSERKNQTVEIAIRMFAATNPDDPWTKVIPILQQDLNNAYSATIKASPNELLYGFKTNDALALLSDKNIVKDRELLQEEAKLSIAVAQMRMKKHYDKTHRFISFAPGDYVYLKLGHGYSLPGKPPLKWTQQRIPLKVLERVGKLAYRLELPPTMNIHPVVSVANLLPAEQPGSDPYGREDTFAGPVEVEGDDPSAWRDSYQHYEVERILDKRAVRYGRSEPRTEYLIKWVGWPSQYNVWMDVGAMEAPELRETFERKLAKMQALRSKLNKEKDHLQDQYKAPEPGEIVPDQPQSSQKKRGRPPKNKPPTRNESRQETEQGKPLRRSARLQRPG
jgi:hypothetical protein